MQGMEGSGEPVSPFDSYVDLNPQASSMVEGPRISAANAIPEHHGGSSVTSAPARMASLDESVSPHASPSSTGETATSILLLSMLQILGEVSCMDETRWAQ